MHHIIELTPQNIHDNNVSLNPDNLMSLCWRCHDLRTKGYDGDVMKEYMFDENGHVVLRDTISCGLTPPIGK